MTRLPNPCPYPKPTEDEIRKMMPPPAPPRKRKAVK